MAEHRAEPSERTRSAVKVLVGLLLLGVVATGVVLVGMACTQ